MKAKSSSRIITRNGPSYSSARKGEISQNVHMVVVGGEFWERHLLFRDYLRTHLDAVEAYVQIKRELAPQFDDTNDYAKAKTEFISGMVADARKWKTKQNEGTNN